MSRDTTPSEPHDVCAAVLEAVARRHGSEAEAEVTAWAGRSALTRFANSHIHQNVADDHVGARLRMVIEGRVATAVTGRVNPEGVWRLVSTATEIAARRAPDRSWPGTTPPTEVDDVGHYDPRTHLADPRRRAEAVAGFISAGIPGDGGQRLEAAGFCATDGGHVAFANSRGHSVAGFWSRAEVEGVQRHPRADGGAASMAVSLDALDGAGAGARAAGRARRGADPVDLEPGRYPVVLLPGAVADVVDFLSGGFNAKHHAEGQSFVELGRAQFDPAIDVYDDATDPRALGLGFDAEGTPKGRVDLVRGGVCRALVHDRRTAAASGALSTGHAVSGGETAGPGASNVFLGEGTATVEDMISAMDLGLVVTQFWYTRILDPKTQVVTGLTRNGTFLVQGGQITSGVANLRFTQSYVEALAPGRVLAVGSEAELAGENRAWVPSLYLAEWNFTGGPGG